MLSWIQEITSRFEQNYFVQRAGDRRIVDKSINNYLNLARIVMVYPQAKFIDLRRHPLDIIYSNYRQNFAVEHNFSFDLVSLANHYCTYRRLIDYWCRVFPENVCSISYETLVHSPEPVLRRVLEFCGLHWEHACLDYRKDIAIVHTASAEQVRQPLYSTAVYGWEVAASHLAPAAAELGDYANYHPLEA